MRTVSSKFFDTQAASFSTEELVLLRHARCVLSRLCCSGHSLLLSSYLFRIGRIENPSCSASGHLSSHFTLSLRQPRTLCADHSVATLSTTSNPGLGKFPGFWGSMVFRHYSIPRKGSGNSNNNNNRRILDETTATNPSVWKVVVELVAFTSLKFAIVRCVHMTVMNK